MLYPVSDSTFNQKLMHTFHFSAEDIAANRQGRVSEAQVLRLRSQQRRILMFTGAALSAIIAMIALVFAADRANEGGITVDNLLAIIVPMGIVTILGLYALWRQQLVTVNRLLYADIHTLKGEIVLSPRTKRSAEHLTIGKTHFVLTPAQFQLLSEQAEQADSKLRYHIYRVKRISQILSIEAVG